MNALRDAERATVLPPVAGTTVPVPAGRTMTAAGGSTATAEPAPRGRRRHRSLWGELWRWVTTTIVFALVAVVVAGLSLVAAIYWQARTDQTRPVDAIVVLGTAQHNGRPGPVLLARLEHALAVYDDGTAPVIVVTGGRAPGDQFTEAEAARDYLLERGVPASALLLENEGRDSWTSMQGVAALLAETGRSHVLLISDGFHLLRVKLMARDLGLTPFASSAPNSPIRPGGPAELSYVLREAAGIAAHLFHTRSVGR